MEPLFPLLIVEDNPVSLKAMEKTLRGAGYPVSSAQNGAQALSLLREKFFPVVITDREMPEMDGLGLCRRIRKEEFPGYIYILMLTSKNSKEDIVEGLEAGADQYLVKPLDPKELLARLKSANRILELESFLKKVNQEFRNLSIYDHLTGAFNRAYLSDQFPNEIKRCLRYSQSLSLIMCDIDGFKKVNDSYGHLSGDFILKKFVDLLKKTIRDGVDWIARYGGDEFLIVLPNTDLNGAHIVAQRLTHLLGEEVLVIKGRPIKITASFGVTGIDFNRQDALITPELLIEEADECLHQGKTEGGNRTKMHFIKEDQSLQTKSWKPIRLESFVQ